jgi:hypothetical protein
MPITLCEVDFPHGRTVVRHMYGDDPPRVATTVGIYEELGLWLVQRVTHDNSVKYVDGDHVVARLTVVLDDPHEAATGDTRR